MTQLWEHMYEWVPNLYNTEIFRNVEGFWRVAKWAKGGINKRDLLNIRSILMVVFWNIWFERNRRIFKDAHVNTYALLALIEDNIVL